MLTPFQILEKIDRFVEAAADQSFRTHLGASDIGRKCSREIWYRFRWVGQERFDSRMLRLFDRGKREEMEIVRLLRGAGFEVHTPSEGNVEDFQFADCEKHFGGTCDGIVLIPEEVKTADKNYAVLEGKTYATERFKKLKQTGVKESDPVYFSQLQVYAGELGLEWGLFFAVCKETDEIYLEWVRFDPIHFNACLTKAEAIVNATAPPDRISNDPNTFTCRYCNFRSLCHTNENLATNLRHCRNCTHSRPAPEGQWLCTKGRTFGTLCSQYSFAG